MRERRLLRKRFTKKKHGITVLSLFDGYGSGMLALKKLRVPIANYYASEIEPNAIFVTDQAFPNIQHFGSVEGWRNWDIDWSSVDLILAGSPCTGFSLQGKMLAFDDPQSKLFFIFEDILHHIQLCNPKVKFLLENTKMAQWCIDEITSRVGVKPTPINSVNLGYGLRYRYYWTNWDIAPVKPRHLDPHDIIEGPGFPATVKKGAAVKGQVTPRNVIATDYFMCLTASYAKGIRADGRPMVTTKTGPFDDVRDYCRKLTITEAERLMGVPVGHTNGVKKTLAYKLLGNGWHVPTITHILKGAGLPTKPMLRRLT